MWLMPAIATAASAPATKEVDLGGGVTLTLVEVKGGRFVEGSPATESGRKDDEAQRTVTVSGSFWMGQTPVTRGAWERFVAETRYRSEAEKGTSGGSGWDGTQLVQKPAFNWRNPGFTQGPDEPVVLVTYSDALAFAAWLGRKTAMNVTLPTEAQWEYACRANTSDATYLGEKPARDLGWYKQTSGNHTHPVKQTPANPWGLYDMLGNVNEWALDYYAPYAPGPVIDPVEESPARSDGGRRVLRGVSWLRDKSNARCAARYRNSPGSRNADNGFRIIATEGHAQAPLTPSPTTSSDPTTSTAITSSSDSSATGTSATTTTSSGGGAAGCHRPIGFIVLIAFGIWFLFRPRKSGGATPLSKNTSTTWSSRVRLRPAADGFRILAPPSLEGGALRYTYTFGGAMKTGDVALAPTLDGQFVFLGHRPTKLRILSLRTPQGDVEEPSDSTTYVDDGPYIPPSTNYGPPSAY